MCIQCILSGSSQQRRAHLEVRIRQADLFRAAMASLIDSCFSISCLLFLILFSEKNFFFKIVCFILPQSSNLLQRKASYMH